MKKLYQKPEIQVVRINHSVQLLAGSEKYTGGAKGLSNNAGFDKTITGSNGGGRSRGWDDWDDEEW